MRYIFTVFDTFTKKYKIISSKDHYSKIERFFASKVVSFPKISLARPKSFNSGVSIDQFNVKLSDRKIQDNISKHLKSFPENPEGPEKEGKSVRGKGADSDHLLIPFKANNKISFKKQNSSNFDFQNLFLNDEPNNENEKKSRNQLDYLKSPESIQNLSLARKFSRLRQMSRSSSFNIFNVNPHSNSPKKERKTIFGGEIDLILFNKQDPNNVFYFKSVETSNSIATIQENESEFDKKTSLRPKSTLSLSLMFRI